jgi:hypothetical protein
MANVERISRFGFLDLKAQNRLSRRNSGASCA